MDPTVQRCRAPVPTRSWDLWAESEPIPGLLETELYSQSQESLTSDPPNPRFVRGDQCDWRRRLAWRPVSFVFVFFGIMCIFFRVVICPLCALVFLFTFFQDQILSVLHNSAHIHVRALKFSRFSQTQLKILDIFAPIFKKRSSALVAYHRALLRSASRLVGYLSPWISLFWLYKASVSSPLALLLIQQSGRLNCGNISKGLFALFFST